MKKAYQESGPLFIKTNNKVWGLPPSNSDSTDEESSDEESPFSSFGSTSSSVTHDEFSETASTKTMSSTYLNRPAAQPKASHLQDKALFTKSTYHKNMDAATDCFISRNSQRISRTREVDLESAVYHQHLIAPNESIACIHPNNITLYPSSDEKRNSSIASIATITVENTSTKTLITQNNESIKVDKKQGQDSLFDQQLTQEIKKEYTLPKFNSVSSSRNNSGKGNLALPKGNLKRIILFAKRKQLSDNEDGLNSTIDVPKTPILVTKSACKKTKNRVRFTSDTKKESTESSDPRLKKKRRTVTSYDSQTSFYLKSVFFEVYSYQKKLTKKQRAEVQKETGLPSRNVTYWFSNHKRRFYRMLEVYRQTVKASKGSVNSYAEFLEWRREQGLPDQISQGEVLQAEQDLKSKKIND